MRLIVFGSRDYKHRDRVEEELLVFTASGYRTIVHGACPTGADHYAHEWVKRHIPLPHRAPVVEDPHPADWDTHGNAAGPRRNQAMVDKGATYALGFWDGSIEGSHGRGSMDMLGRLVASGTRCSMTPDADKIAGSKMLDHGDVRERVRRTMTLLQQGYRVFV